MIITATSIATALGTALTALGFSVAGTALATTLTVLGWVGAALIYGGMALSVIQANRTRDFGSMSPTYQGRIQTQTDQNLPVPLLYGTCKVAGNRIWQDENYMTTVKRIVAFAEGEICEYSDIKLNDISMDEIAGISVNRYYGTNDQTVDAIVGGANQSERAEKVGSLKNVAYLAISVPRSQKIDMNYNLTAIVKGRKIRVYSNKYEYEVKYSENPAWCLFDFLTCYNGLGLCIDNSGNINDDLIYELFDMDSFLESAQYCDEEIQSEELVDPNDESKGYKTYPPLT